MTRSALSLALFCVALPLVAKDPLPVPLRLPPGNIQMLYLDRDASYMGDAVRIVDCPKKEDNPLGVCGNLVFGGVAMWNTHLSGNIIIKFYPPINDVSHFELSHPFNLVSGDDVVMTAPQLYSYVIKQSTLLDPLSQVSTGDLNLVTGEVTNLNYKAIFSNNWYNDLVLVNPKLKPPAFTFPGTYGSAEATFEQRADGLLDFTFYGSTFLPLGSNVNGDPLRVPMPMCGPLVQCASLQVPGMSLHPHVRISSKQLTDLPCRGTCMPIQPNSVMEFTLNTRFSTIGDDFKLNIPQLGGGGLGSSQMQGRIQVQFGNRHGKFLPVAINALPPGGLLVPPPPFPINGLSLGFVGFDENLVFPKATYKVQGVAITDDPFDIPVGELNLETGTVVGGLLWRTFWNTSLLNAILVQNNGRLLPQSFFMRGPALFQVGQNAQNMFRYNGSEYRPFEGFTFPSTDYTDPSRSYTAGPGSVLAPFFRMQAATPTDTPTLVMRGGQTNVLSSFGERFNYSYSISCNAPGAPAEFEYTNQSSGTTGGTFRMENIGSVQCLNSLNSTQPRGNYDTLTFTGFGTWSKNDDPHLATVQISLAPNAPYVSIQIDGGTLSNVNTKPNFVPEP